MAEAPRPRWRMSRFGDQLELVTRRPGGGPAIWFGSVGPVIGDGCSYSGPGFAGRAATQEEAKAAIERTIEENRRT